MRHNLPRPRLRHVPALVVATVATSLALSKAWAQLPPDPIPTGATPCDGLVHCPPVQDGHHYVCPPNGFTPVAGVGPQTWCQFTGGCAPPLAPHRVVSVQEIQATCTDPYGGPSAVCYSCTCPEAGSPVVCCTNSDPPPTCPSEEHQYRPPGWNPP